MLRSGRSPVAQIAKAYFKACLKNEQLGIPSCSIFSGHMTFGWTMSYINHLPTKFISAGHVTVLANRKPVRQRSIVLRALKCTLMYFAIVYCTRDRRCIFLLILSWRVLCRYIIKNSLCFAYTFVLQTDATMYHFLFIFFSYLILSLIRVLLSCYMNENICVFSHLLFGSLYICFQRRRKR